MKSSGLGISWEKSKMVVIEKGKDGENNIRLGEEDLMLVKIFEYLGREIS